MKAATLNDTARNEEAVREADAAVNVLQRLVDAGRSDLERLLALGWLGRSQACLHLRQVAQGARRLRPCPSLVHSTDPAWMRRPGPAGWRFALLNRGRSALRSWSGSGRCRRPRQGFDLLQHLIAKGEPEDSRRLPAEVDRGGQVFANRVSG